MPKTTERTMTMHFTPNDPKSLSYPEELIDYQNHKMCTKAKQRNTKGRYTLVTLRRNVTPYRDSVDGTCEHVTSKVGYAVTLRACSVSCRYLTVASKGWYGYGLSRCGRAA
jgi:hypothetical protein